MRCNSTRPWVLGATVVMAGLAAVPAVAVGVPGMGTWETTLQARGLDGNGATDAFYATELDITWLRDANVNGPLDRDTARAWAGNLAVGGVTGWRLPTMIDTGLPGCDYAYVGTDCGYNVQTREGSTVYSELAHQWYVTLGNPGGLQHGRQLWWLWSPELW